jgi:hypothetical protein
MATAVVCLGILSLTFDQLGSIFWIVLGIISCVVPACAKSLLYEQAYLFMK